MVDSDLTPQSFVDAIRGFVEYQKRLASTFSSRNNGGSSVRHSSDLLDDGFGGRWQARVHGQGVAFKEVLHGYLIDLHKHYDHPEWIDPWRIELFLNSLSAGTQRRYHGELGELSLEQYMRSLADNNVLTREGSDAFSVVARA